MEIIKIVPSESKLWDQVWRLYNESFPEYERRRISSHSRASEDATFHTYIAVDNGNLLGLLFYWNYDKKIYIEHLAVNPTMRGKSIGSNIMKEFIAENKGATIILEIDPPVDDISKRRLSFYEKLGFRDTKQTYRHPSYSKNGQPHLLRILSYPKSISEHEFEEFQKFMFEKVMKYID